MSSRRWRRAISSSTGRTTRRKTSSGPSKHDREDVMAEILCPSCQHFAPALDPNIARAFLGACKKKEAPFLLILPKEGVVECPVYLKAARAAQVAHAPPPLEIA